MKEKIEFTKYAELQIQERKITHKEVLETIKLSEQTLHSKKGRKIAQKKLKRSGNEGLLRVIFEEKNNVKTVVTVYWTSKIEKYWR